MNYDSMLKEINDATALRELMDNVAKDLADIDAQIDQNQKEIEKRKSLEKVTEGLVTKRAETLKTLQEHEAELSKRLTKLGKEGITLPIDASPKPFVHS